MLRSIITVLSGTVIAQLISLAALPFLSRVYSAEDFGGFQVYVSILNILLIVVAFRFEVALLSAHEERSYSLLLRLTSRLSLITSGIALIAVLAFGPVLNERLPELGSLIYVFPAAMLVAGLLQMMTYLPLRNRDYRLAARVRVVQALSYVAGSAAFAFLPLFGLGLQLGDLIGRIGAFITIGLGTPKSVSDAVGKISVAEARDIATRYREYPILMFPGTLLSALVAGMAPLAFLGLFGLEAAGQYALVERFILMPVGLLAAAVAQVFTGDFARSFRDDTANLHSVFRRTVLSLLAIGIVPCLAGYIVAPFAVPFVFGEQWQLAGQLCSIAMGIALVSFVAAPLHMVLVICGQSRLQLVWEIGRFLVMLLLFLGLIAFGVRDPVDVMLAYVLANAASYIAYLLLADRVSKNVSEKVLVATKSTGDVGAAF
ncbi:lipopolysaccharide biosynthesis protein [Devosia riboflavina]